MTDIEKKSRNFSKKIPKTTKYQMLSKFKRISDDRCFYEDTNEMWFEFCEPFIGQLPTFLKD